MVAGSPSAYHDTLTIPSPCIRGALPALHLGRYIYIWHNWIIIITECSAPATSFSTRYLHPPWLIIKDLDAIRHSSGESDEFLVRGIFVHIVVAVLFIVKLDYETVGRIALCMLAAARRIYGKCLYAVAFRAIVLATREGLDVWLLRCWVNALVFEAQHTIARL